MSDTRAPEPTMARAPDPEPDPTLDMFASRSLTEHVVRGVLGLVLVALAVVSAQDHPWALLALVPAVVAWRGCPTCWLMGLGATLTRRRTGRACDTC
jgi:hypothetical protein